MLSIYYASNVLNHTINVKTCSFNHVNNMIKLINVLKHANNRHMFKCANNVLRHASKGLNHVNKITITLATC